MNHPDAFALARPFGRAALALTACLLFASLGSWIQADQPLERDDTRPLRQRGDVIRIWTGDVEIPANTIRDGSVVCVGGRVLIRGEVTRDVVVILGELDIDGGHVGRNATGVLSRLELREADVDGDLVNILGGISHADLYVGHQMLDLGNLHDWLPAFLKLLTWLRVVGLLFVFVVLVLLVGFVPERVQLIGRETPVRYASALFAGLLAYLLLLLFVLPLAAVTVIGLPLLVFTFLLLKWLGVAGMFHVVGQRIARGFGREMSPLGAVLLVYSAYVAILLVLSLLGPVGLMAILLFRVVFFFFVEAPAVGLCVLTRIGTRGGEHPPGPAVAWSPTPPPGGPAANGSSYSPPG